MERCRTELPPLRPVARADAADPRVAACWLQDGSAPPPAELARPEPGPGRPGPGVGGTAADTGADTMGGAA